MSESKNETYNYNSQNLTKNKDFYIEPETGVIRKDPESPYLGAIPLDYDEKKWGGWHSFDQEFPFKVPTRKCIELQTSLEKLGGTVINLLNYDD